VTCQPRTSISKSAGCNPIVNGSEQERLCGTTRCARRTDPHRVDIWQRGQKIESAFGVPHLQRKRTE
jgi:hypothetical protein